MAFLKRRTCFVLLHANRRALEKRRSAVWLRKTFPVLPKSDFEPLDSLYDNYKKDARAAGRGNRMILDLKGVFECEGYSRDVSYPLDLSGFEDQPGVFPFKEPVEVHANLRNRAGVVELHVETQSVFSTQCDRCCVPLNQKLSISFDNVLVRDAASEGDSGDLVKVEGDSFDLDELVSTNIILNLPMKHLCSETCKGLCPKCGKNLNEGDCGCDRRDDSPFSVLKSLL